MAIISISRYFAPSILLILCLKSIGAVQNSDFSFNGFGKNPNFESNIAFYGDAKVVRGGYSVHLTGSPASSGGRIVYKKPIKLVGGNPRVWVSFSTYFSFSMSPKIGNALAFVMAPKSYNFDMFNNNSFGLFLDNKTRVVAIEVDTVRDKRMNDNHVGIAVGSLVSVKSKNVSSINLVLVGGHKLHSWIDYEAGSKRLEVRLSRSAETRPVDPLLSCPIDLSKIWEDEEMLIGLSSSNENYRHKCLIHSWSFKLRSFTQLMHSQPLDPKVISKTYEPQEDRERNNCLSRMLAAMIFGTGCGALVAFIILHLWTIFGSRWTTAVPVEYTVQPVDLDSKKVKVVVDKAIHDGKK